MTHPIDFDQLEALTHTLEHQIHGVASLVAAEASETVVIESLLEALMPLAQAYEQLREDQDPGHHHPLPWLRGTVIRFVDPYSTTSVMYGVVVEDAFEAGVLTICQADGLVTHLPLTAVQWVSDPCPTSWALVNYPGLKAGA